jgi:hypothetical protein
MLYLRRRATVIYKIVLFEALLPNSKQDLQQPPLNKDSESERSFSKQHSELANPSIWELEKVTTP